jgi:2-polyprenyl-3-methyl-5-hydroxy-6-metoxy-1,4-benzoquinol methylase
MQMFRGMKQRAEEHELMDDYSSGGEELREALRHLRLLNRIFAAASPTLYGIRKLWKAANKPKRLSILDIGSGSGDVNLKLLKWADANKIKLHITLVDITEEACEEARMFFHNEQRIQVIRCDVFALKEAVADVVTATQFVHHFREEELSAVVSSMMQASRLGIVINDLHRHWLSWTAVWLTTRAISKNRYIRNDGPLSVAKGFRSEDWRRLRQALEAPELYAAWRPLFRYVVVIQKMRAKSNDGAEQHV